MVLYVGEKQAHREQETLQGWPRHPATGGRHGKLLSIPGYSPFDPVSRVYPECIQSLSVVRCSFTHRSLVVRVWQAIRSLLGRAQAYYAITRIDPRHPADRIIDNCSQLCEYCQTKTEIRRNEKDRTVPCFQYPVGLFVYLLGRALAGKTGAPVPAQNPVAARPLPDVGAALS